MIVTSFILPLMIKSKNISTQDDWDNLLNLIHEGTLTPVIGQELFKYKENNELFSIDNYLSKKLLEKKHFDFLIFGHRHLPLDIKINGSSRYINLGDWIRYNSYGIFDGNEFKLEYF